MYVEFTSRSMRELIQNTRDMSRVMHLQQVKFKICAIHFTYSMKRAGEEKKTKENSHSEQINLQKCFSFQSFPTLHNVVFFR